MPKRKIKATVKKVTQESNKKGSIFDIFSKIKLSESYISLTLGIIVVIIAAFFVVSFAKNIKHSISPTQETSSEKTQEAKSDKKFYTVNAGDDLWSISEKVYNSGYNWVDIANANKLENPGILYAGTKLEIPNVKAKTAESTEVAVKEVSVSQAPTPTQDILATSTTAQKEGSISGNSYTVQEGDYLWDIAVRAYGDGYKWTEIAQANNLSNPDFIYSGNVLKLPR